jgi:hypothetical protein
MKRLQSRADLKQRILMTLGHPYIKVDLSDEHIDNCIDTALRHFFKYSPYGSFENFYIYTITAQDVANNYIPIPRTIDAVVEVIEAGQYLSDMSFATVEYQMTRDTFMSGMKFNNVSLLDFVTLRQRLDNTMSMIQTAPRFEFVRYQRRLIPTFDLNAGYQIALRVYENVDPEAADIGVDPANVIPAADLWDDELLLQLAVGQCKMVWGNILKKFGQVVLPGGVTLDGQKMYDEGRSDFDRASSDMLNSSPMDFFMG